MKIKSLHQDNHTKKKICYGIHKNIWKNIGEKTILYYHFLNTYTEYFINGILQHCKHIVRLNVHVWFLRSLSGFSHRFSSFECDFRSVFYGSGGSFSVFSRPNSELSWDETHCAIFFTTGNLDFFHLFSFLHSCINMCKQADSSSSSLPPPTFRHHLPFIVSKYIEISGNGRAYGELLWPQHHFLSNNKPTKKKTLNCIRDTV